MRRWVDRRSLTSSPPLVEEIPAVSEIRGISDHLGGFPLRRGCPGEKAWFSPRSTPTMGSLTRFVPQPQTPPGLTTSPQALLPACPAVGLSTSKILSDGSGDIEPPRRRAILPRPEGQGLTRHLVMGRPCLARRKHGSMLQPSCPLEPPYVQLKESHVAEHYLGVR